MRDYARESRPWMIWLTVAAVMLAGVGIFFYYTMFRQAKSELIEAIPTDATFIFALNDNEAFVRGSTQLTPCLNELFLLDAMPAYQTIRGKLPKGGYDLTVSGHTNNEAVSLLFNMHADKAAFKRLLRALSIDPNNYTSFEGNRIYTYGTNFKSMKFVFLNHVISFSTDMDLLKRAIVQHTHPKNLLSDKQFQEMYALTEKNQKQNWLLVNPNRYLSYFTTFLDEKLSQTLSNGLSHAGWTAFQLRFSGNEMFLSGYMFTDDPGHGFFELLENRTGDGQGILDLYPAQSHWYAHLETPQVKNLALLNGFSKEERTLMKSLNPTEVGYFLISRDSVDYQYVVMSSDTNKEVLEVFYGDKADSAQTSTPDGIYSIPDHLAPLMKSLAPDSVGCFMQREGALVFASSKEAMKVYQNSMKASGSLSQNRYYPFVNEAVASSSVMNFVLFNKESDPYWMSQISEKGKVSHVGQQLRILSLSCETMEKGKNLVPVNLFMLF